MKLYFLILFIVLSLPVFGTDVFVTMNRQNLTEISKDTVVKIMRAEMLNWESGNSINILINDIDATDTTDMETVLDMSKKQFLEYWRIKFFSGRALMPKQVKNISSILPVLTENKNSIYVSIGKAPEKDVTDNPLLKTLVFKF